MKKKKIGLFYNKKEEQINTLSHAVGILIAVLTLLVFIPLSLKINHTLAPLSIILYVFGMGGSYLTSTCYHAFKHRNPLKAKFRHWDHAAIYWHIAGSYSPICLILLRNQQFWGWGLFIFMWTAAIAGTAASFRKMEEHSHIETICFLAMGLSAVALIKPLLTATPTYTILYWIMAEGFFYITGSVFYTTRHRRYMHSVFHFFVLLGSISHLIAVWYILTTCAA